MNEPKNEFKSFLDAVRGDDLKLAKKYYKKDFKPEILEAAVVLAVNKNSVQMLEFLDECGVFFGVFDGRRPLVRAAVSGSLDAIKWLCAQTVNDSMNYGEALKGAAHAGRLEVVKFLLSQDVPAQSTEAIQSALNNASNNGHGLIVEILMANGANPALNDYYAVSLALSGGHLHLVKQFAEAGVDLVNGFQGTLAVAAWRGRVNVLKWLGLNIDHYDNILIEEAFIKAAMANQVEVLRLFVNNKWHECKKNLLEETTVAISGKDQCFDAFVYLSDQLSPGKRHELWHGLSSKIDSNLSSRIQGHVQHDLLKLESREHLCQKVEVLEPVRKSRRL